MANILDALSVYFLISYIALNPPALLRPEAFDCSTTEVHRVPLIGTGYPTLLAHLTGARHNPSELLISGIITVSASKVHERSAYKNGLQVVYERRCGEKGPEHTE